MTELMIRPLGLHPEAIPVVAGWLFDEWGHRRPGSTLNEATSLLSERANMKSLPIAGVAISSSGIPLATARLVEREEDNDEFGPWVASVYTVPPARRTGLATQLVRHVEKETFLIGYERILPATSNTKLYEDLGWHPTDRTKYGESVMEKKIRPVL